MLALPILPPPVASGPQAVAGAADAGGSSAGDAFTSLLAGLFPAVVTTAPEPSPATTGATVVASDQGGGSPLLVGPAVVGLPLAEAVPLAGAARGPVVQSVPLPGAAPGPGVQSAPPAGAALGPAVQSASPATELAVELTGPIDGRPLVEAAAQGSGPLLPVRAAMAPVETGSGAAPRDLGPAVATAAGVDPRGMVTIDPGEARIDGQPLRRAALDRTPVERSTVAATTAVSTGPTAVPAAAPEPQSPRALVDGPDLAADPAAEGADGLPTRAERPAIEQLGPSPRTTASPGVQIGMQIARAAPGRVTKMMVQLEPAQLGRVEIRLEFGPDNRLTALITAERPETLDVLQRDTRALERSLEAAGLSLDDEGLSFLLEGQDPRDGHMARQQRALDEGAGRCGDAPVGPAEPETDANRWVGGFGLLDIRV